MDSMLNGISLPRSLYDVTLANFDAQVTVSGIIFDAGDSKYCNVAAHDSLINTHGWTITDGGLDSNCPDPLDDFVITVKTDHPGTSADNEFTIPTNLSETYDYSVDCDNDGINEIVGATGNFTCVYASAGTYTVRIKHNQATNAGFPRIYFNGNGDTQKLLTIEQWGTNPWSSMSSAFEGASNLTTTALDVPDFSNMISMYQMFKNATLATPNTSNWDTFNITTMFEMFTGATSVNPDTSNWNIENVTIMANMFLSVTLPTVDYDAMLKVFSQQNVKQNVLFHGGNSKYCAQSAHDILDIDNSWTIVDGGLDTNCPNPLNDFVIEIDTTILGQKSNPNTEFEINTTATGYNYNVDCDDNNAGTNTATGQIGNYTCHYAIPGIYTIRISDNKGDKTGFPRIYSIPHLDADKIINLKQWGTGAWDSMSAAFIRATNMTVTATDIPDLSNVLDMGSMFAYASSANPDVSGWNTANVTNMHSMFIDATSAAPDISNWDLSGITVPFSMDSMLNGTSLPRALYDTTLTNFDAQLTTSGIIFDAGDSKYCNVAAHDSLINNHGWTITDGGLDSNCIVDIIFSNGFENIIIFNSQEAQFVYDFSQLSINQLDQTPLLIAKGINEQHQPTLLIYLRNDLGQLQIRQDFIDEHNQWIQGQWQSIVNNKNTLIHWSK
jgi:surface protein